MYGCVVCVLFFAFSHSCFLSLSLPGIASIYITRFDCCCCWVVCWNRPTKSAFIVRVALSVDRVLNWYKTQCVCVRCWAHTKCYGHLASIYTHKNIMHVLCVYRICIVKHLHNIQASCCSFNVELLLFQPQATWNPIYLSNVNPNDLYRLLLKLDTRSVGIFHLKKCKRTHRNTFIIAACYTFVFLKFCWFSPSYIEARVR